MKVEEKIARQILEQYGYNFSDAFRGGGWTNAVWLNEEVVIRVSHEKGNNIKK